MAQDDTFISHILLPADGSEGGLRAAEFAGRMARVFGAHVTVLIVHDLDVYALHAEGLVAWPGISGLSAISRDEIESQVTERVSQPVFEKTLDALGKLAEPAACHEMWGQVAEAICDYAKTEHCDLIVMGSRGRSAFTSLLLGSTSLQVLHHAEVPVTIVR